MSRTSYYKKTTNLDKSQDTRLSSVESSINTTNTALTNITSQLTSILGVTSEDWTNTIPVDGSETYNYFIDFAGPITSPTITELINIDTNHETRLNLLESTISAANNLELETWDGLIPVQIINNDEIYSYNINCTGTITSPTITELNASLSSQNARIVYLENKVSQLLASLQLN